MAFDNQSELILLKTLQLKKLGFHNIRSDATSENQPNEIIDLESSIRFKPNITAIRDNINYIFEVVMPEAFDTPYSLTKWSMYAEIVRHKNYNFTICVPKGYLTKIQDVLDQQNFVINVEEL